MEKITLFRDRLQLALNFFDIFNEGFDPLSLEVPLDLSKCYLPLISSHKNLIQKSNISISLINSLINFCPSTSKSRIMKTILKKYFLKEEMKPKYDSRSQNQTIVKYCYEFLCDISNLHDLCFLQNFAFDRFEVELQFKGLDAETLHIYMDRLYLIDKRPIESLSPDDVEFILSFFSDNFLINFTVALTFLFSNLMFFLVGFNDTILKKIYLSNREDPELSIIELLACREFNLLKDFAMDFLQNKDSAYYSQEIFNKYHQDFLKVAKNVYYQEDYARILLYSKINIGFEKINIILGNIFFKKRKIMDF